MNKQQFAEMMEAAVPFAAFFASLINQGLSREEAIALTGQFMHAVLAVQTQKNPDLESLFNRIVVVGEKQ
jgi:hypothetical protein